MIIDNFAGGGGASLGIERALGRSPDIAVNHDPEAVALHTANHPTTRHLCGDVWDVKPAEVCAGRTVELAWFSPDCKHFSRAKGGKPVSKKIRGLAWVVTRWAAAVKPRVIILENVEEFETWGPLVDDRPCPERRGLTFRRWVGRLRNLGYEVQWRALKACDYGAPTTRQRLFLVARCDGLPIVWPERTHRPGTYRSASECMDWGIPVPSIFERRKPLAEKTLRRIARGVRRYVLEADRPFIVPTARGAASPTLIQTGYGERPGQAPRALDLGQPLGTVVAGGVKHALVAAFLAKHYGGNENDGVPCTAPLATITAQDHHALVTTPLGAGDHVEDVRAFLTKFYGTSTGAPLQLPLGAITAQGQHLGLVTVQGQRYQIGDIGMRMLVPRELYRGQGFPDSYKIDIEYNGKPLSKTAQVRMCGNSVSPPVAEAVVKANCAHLAQEVAA